MFSVFVTVSRFYSNLGFSQEQCWEIKNWNSSVRISILKLIIIEQHLSSTQVVNDTIATGKPPKQPRLPLENLIEVCDVARLKIIDLKNESSLIQEFLLALKTQGPGVIILKTTWIYQPRKAAGSSSSGGLAKRKHLFWYCNRYSYFDSEPNSGSEPQVLFVRT